ncbi:MAG TPA: amidase, partial [Anaerolineae bacterium]|nr:amidase [Anaerolineae bacterium]
MTNMEELTISELQERMATGRLTARALAEMCLERVDRLDRQGPAINSVIEVNPDALQIADMLDGEREERGPRGPLHGIPVMLKDNIATRDRMTTSAGSLALTGSIAPRDAFVVQRLREVGAVILAKTNLSEWANFRSSHSSSGWSSRGGQTRNPYALDRNPCGSSSGSAAAVAAGLCPVAVGTETDGSVICPSHANGIVGIKPTLGLVGRSGIIPIAHSQDTAGPMGRTVADAAILLGAMAGMDPRDPLTMESRGRSHTDYSRFLDAKGLQGARIGVARSLCGFSEKVDALLEGAIEQMRRLGAEIVDPCGLPSAAEMRDTEYLVLLYEFKADLNRYLEGLGPEAPVHSLQEIIEFNELHRDRVMPHFGQDILLQAQEKGPLSTEEYVQALETKQRLSRAEGIDAILQEHDLQAIVVPSGRPAWLTDWVNGDCHSGGSSSFAAVAGYPNITVPMGTINGLPVGLSFFSTAY